VYAFPRFVADTLEFPFIVIQQRTFDLESEQVIDEVASVATAEFGALRPQRVCLYQAGTPEPASALRRMPRLSAYKRYLAAPFAQLTDSPPPRLADRIRVTPATTLSSFYAEYARMYDEFHEDAPQLRDHVRKETPEDMQHFMDEGEMRLVWVDGELAGVMAASPALEHGLRGWCMKERVFGRAYRGGGFGPAALWAFIRTLQFQSGDLLWGTIVPENHASMQSALRLGRVDIGGFFWVDVT
jgi:hypothetical protein